MDSFETGVDKVSKEMGSSSDFYKLVEGDNRLHILTEPNIEVSRWGFGTCYEGAPFCNEKLMDAEYEAKVAKAKADGLDPKDISQPQLTKKWLCWAIDRKSQKLVILTLTWAIAKQLTALKRSEESGFEGWPMPYGINISATDNGKKFNGKVVFDYNILPSRKDTAITEEELAKLAKCTPVETIIEKKKEKARAAQGGVSTSEPVHTEEEASDDIPF
jgi:hypothetical protein